MQWHEIIKGRDEIQSLDCNFDTKKFKFPRVETRLHEKRGKPFWVSLGMVRVKNI